MGNIPRYKGTNLKRGLSRLLVLFLVIYAIGDATVLQVYCGNETVGIPPAHHTKGLQAKATHQCANHTEKHSPSSVSNNDHHSNEQESNENCNDECLSCSHILVGFFAIGKSLYTDQISLSTPINYESKHPNSLLSGLFRPPQNS